ncbi:MAG: hypothetical protein ACLT76_09325 [Clostridium fessum]
MKHNVFDNEKEKRNGWLSGSFCHRRTLSQVAKTSQVGTFQTALADLCRAEWSSA